jgi:hypothetical protein
VAALQLDALDALDALGLVALQERRRFEYDRRYFEGEDPG